MKLVATARNTLRAALVARQGIDPRLRARPAAKRGSQRGAWQRVCNICGWHGAAFARPAHSEMADCPHCGSIARDRFLYWCWTHRLQYDREARLLETSPRLDAR